MTSQITVIVPTYRRPDRFRRLVDALAQQTLPYDLWDLIVVDDASGTEFDSFYETLEASFPGAMRVLRLPTNHGPDHARNVGWRSSEANIFGFLDDDVVPDPAWLESGLAAMRADESIGVLQGATAIPAGVDVHREPFGTLWREVAGPGPFFEGCNIFYRRAALAAVDGFTVDLDMYGNDSATGWAVTEAGWRRAFASEARVVHDVEPRSFRWWLENGWAERKMIGVAARHPGYRQEAFCRSWAVRKRDAAFLLAVASAAAATTVWRPALLGIGPYVLWGLPIGHEGRSVRDWGKVIVIDAARVAGHLAGSAENRVVVV